MQRTFILRTKNGLKINKLYAFNQVKSDIAFY